MYDKNCYTHSSSIIIVGVREMVANCKMPLKIKFNKIYNCSLGKLGLHTGM